MCCWFKGGHPERLGAAVWLTSWMLGVLSNDMRFGDLRAAVAAIDVATFAAFLWLGLRHQRWWSLGVSACLVLIIVVHVAALLTPQMTAHGEASAQLGLGMLAVLMLGASAFERLPAPRLYGASDSNFVRFWHGSELTPISSHVRNPPLSDRLLPTHCGHCIGAHCLSFGWAELVFAK